MPLMAKEKAKINKRNHIVENRTRSERKAEGRKNMVSLHKDDVDVQDKIVICYWLLSVSERGRLFSIDDTSLLEPLFFLLAFSSFLWACFL